MPYASLAAGVSFPSPWFAVHVCAYSISEKEENTIFVKSLICLLNKLAIDLSLSNGLANLFGQSQYVPLNTATYDVINRFDIKYGRMIDQFHTSQKPYTRRSIATFSATLEKQNLRNRDLPP